MNDDELMMGDYDLAEVERELWPVSSLPPEVLDFEEYLMDLDLRF